MNASLSLSSLTIPDGFTLVLASISKFRRIVCMLSEIHCRFSILSIFAIFKIGQESTRRPSETGILVN